MSQRITSVGNVKQLGVFLLHLPPPPPEEDCSPFYGYLVPIYAPGWREAL